VREALRTYRSLASGLADVTRQRARSATRALHEQGGLRADQVGAVAEDLRAQGRANRDAVTALVRYEVDRALTRMGLASADDVARLDARLRVLEARLREQSGAGTP
jgi:polyhydroxyalkanoate synthesis regulator phasin